jgi:hypothetical protein
VSGNPRGHGLLKDRLREDAAAAALEAEAIIRDLGRVPSRAEKLLIDQFSALAVKSRRLQSFGRSADDAVRLMTRIGRMLGIAGALANAPHVPLRDRMMAEIAAGEAAGATPPGSTDGGADSPRSRSRRRNCVSATARRR